MTQALLQLQPHNPDVLMCIANLSNDEVFTPPELVSQILDTLATSWAASNNGASIWADKEVTFLDPCTKSGVFLREITKRLTVGLEKQILDLTERVNHILTKQVYGIAITELTSLLARRSLYCSKYANGMHSIARKFKTEEGNIWFQRTEHKWTSGRCDFCSASKEEYGRGRDLETHAYKFLHSLDIKEDLNALFGRKMNFDVVIGNPPYQLSDGGAAASARPIYHLFVEQAQKIDPRYVVMVTPSRWFAGGKGLDQFRRTMLKDRRLRVVVDFIQEKDAFPNVNINGGVNYFLWDREYNGPCEVTTVNPGGAHSPSLSRSLDKYDIFVRRNESVAILEKVLKRGEASFSSRVSSVRPFGLRTFFHGTSAKTSTANIKLYGSGKISWVRESQITSNTAWIAKWKVLIPAASDGNEIYPLPIWDQVGPFIARPNEVCSETYIVASLASTKAEAEAIVQYMRTKFFRFMVSLRKVAQHNKADNFSFVPDLPLDRTWTDRDLYRRFSLTAKEIEHIESNIREMTYGDE